MILYHTSHSGWVNRALFEFLFGEIGFLVSTRAYSCDERNI